MSGQQEMNIYLPTGLGQVVDTIQIEGADAGTDSPTFFANIYGSIYGTEESGYLGIVESSAAQPSIATALQQGLISTPIDWEDVRLNWANEHTGIGVFDTLEDAQSKIRALRSNPPNWLSFQEPEDCRR